MKRFAAILMPALLIICILSCSGATSSRSLSESNTIKTGDTSSINSDAPLGSTAGFKLGVQMWTFMRFSFTDALNKVDSTGIKYIEAFIGQKLGGNLSGSFGLDMTKDTRDSVKSLLKKKGIQIVAMGVIVPRNRAEWIKTFELAKDFGLSYITAEPIKSQWDIVDSLAGVYGIR